MIERARKWMRIRAQRRFRGCPVATVVLYGPDHTRATKFMVGIVSAEDVGVTDLRRWFSEGADIRNDADVAEEVLAFIDAAGARSIVMTDRIIGCPHEENINYEGPTCLACPFWLSIYQFSRHPQSFGSGRHLRRSFMARRRPRVNQESLPRASLAG